MTGITCNQQSAYSLQPYAARAHNMLLYSSDCFIKSESACLLFKEKSDCMCPK